MTYPHYGVRASWCSWYTVRMFISPETNEILKRHTFSRIVTGTIFVFLATALVGLSVVIFYKGDSGGQGGDDIAVEMSSEQRTLIEERIRSGVSAEMSPDQQVTIENRIEHDVPATLSPEQQALIEARMGQ